MSKTTGKMTVAGVSGPKSSAFAEVSPQHTGASSLLWDFPHACTLPASKINNQWKGGEVKGEEAEREGNRGDYTVVFQTHT